MSNKVTTTFVSTQGEVFTGTQKELATEYGITNMKGFYRKSGAVDAAGDRWLAEDKLQGQDCKFQKQELQIGYKEYSFTNKKTGFVEKWIEGQSDSACNYELAKDYIENGDKNGVKTPDRIAAFETLIRKVEPEYDIVNYGGDLTADLFKTPTSEEKDKQEMDTMVAMVRYDNGESEMANKKIAAIHGKLHEYRAGTWHPDQL